MENTYLLLIDQLYIQPVYAPNPEEDGTELIDVVTRVDYRYEATSPDGTVVNWKSVKNMPEAILGEFIDYANVTYEMVQDWVRHNEEEEADVFNVLDNQIKEIEINKYTKPEKLPWEELPPGVDENEGPADPDPNE